MKNATRVILSLLMTVPTLPLTAFAEDKAPEAAREPAAAQATLDDVIQKALKIVIDKSSAAKGRVAVMDFPSLEEQRITALSAYIANKAGNRLIEASRQVVDRAALERIISEQKLQQNSLMDASTAAKIGRLAGAGVFIVGNYSILRKKFVLTVRALSVETGQFVAAAEETAVFNEDFQTEVDDLHKRSITARANANLDGDSSSSDGGGAAEGNKNELAFDKKLCEMLNKGLAFGKVFKLAYDMEMIDVDAFANGMQGVSSPDSTGEEKGPGYAIGSWTILVDNWNYPRSTMGEAIKGKIGSYYVVEGWMYNGSNTFPGLERCSPKAGWWTERRAGGGGGKKKK